ncbi:MAG: serine/threonine protein kinase [Anaerolineae bacterium]
MATDALIGTYLGKYKIEELIGRGGMAEVYRATQVNLERNVAIKVMHRFLSDDGDFLARFEREARVMAKIRHQNIVHVHDYQAEDDYYYIVMDYLSGGTLKNKLDRMTVEGGVINLHQVGRVVLEIGEALAYAHTLGMVHRDIKPANIMFDEKGIAVLTDFGIARMIGGSSHTTTGSMIGTPAYMSPEQGLGESGDERSDIYSLGVLAFHLLTGRLPFEGESPLGVVLKHVNETPPRPSSINPDIPQELEEVVLKAMDKNPENRCATVGEMNREIRSALSKIVSDDDFNNLPDALLDSHPTPIPSLIIPQSEPDSLAFRISRNPVASEFLEESATMLSDLPFDEIGTPAIESVSANEAESFAAPGYEPQAKKQTKEQILETAIADLESMNLLPDLPDPDPILDSKVARTPREPARAPELPPIAVATAETNESEISEAVEPVATSTAELEVDPYEALNPDVHTEEQNEEFATEMTDFMRGFSDNATSAAKLKPEINPLTKKANKKRKKAEVSRTVRGILTVLCVITGIIIGILFVTRVNPNFDPQRIINDQFNNPQIEDIDLSNIVASESLSANRYTRGSLTDTDSAIVLVISNRSSIPPSWAASLEYSESEDVWEPVDGKLAMFDSNGEIVWPVDGSLSTDGVYRWVIRPSGSSDQAIGVSEIFLLPSSEGEISEILVEAN